MTERDPRRLGDVREVFEALGRKDPMWAALARSECRGNRWEPDAFFETGREEIRGVLEYLDALGLATGRGRALDFGCGVGRLSQALAGHFDEVVGVDVARSMVEGARAHNRHGPRVRYLANERPDLRLLDDASFDLVYSNKVLQHLRPPLQLAYVQEFVRVLRPGGVAIFQIRNGPRIRPGSLRALLYRLNRVHLRRLIQRLRGRPPYEMHVVARAQVEEAVRRAGGRLADVVDLSRGRPGKSLRYCALRPGAPLAGA